MGWDGMGWDGMGWEYYGLTVVYMRAYICVNTHARYYP